MSQLSAARLAQIRANADVSHNYIDPGYDPQAVPDLLDEIDALRAALDEVPGYPALLVHDAGAPGYGKEELTP